MKGNFGVEENAFFADIFIFDPVFSNQVPAHVSLPSCLNEFLLGRHGACDMERIYIFIQIIIFPPGFFNTVFQLLCFSVEFVKLCTKKIDGFR